MSLLITLYEFCRPLIHSRSIGALAIRDEHPFTSTGTGLEQVCFNCLATQRPRDKCHNSFPPPDARCLWGWMEQWAGLGWPGRRAIAWWLEDQSKGWIPFWSTAILRYTASLERWELGPITDFASEVEGDKLQYLYLLGKILWPFSLFTSFTGNEISPLTHGCGTFSLLYISLH